MPPKGEGGVRIEKSEMEKGVPFSGGGKRAARHGTALLRSSSPTRLCTAVRSHQDPVSRFRCRAETPRSRGAARTRPRDAEAARQRHAIVVHQGALRLPFASCPLYPPYRPTCDVNTAGTFDRWSQVRTRDITRAPAQRGVSSAVEVVASRTAIDSDRDTVHDVRRFPLILPRDRKKENTRRSALLYTVLPRQTVQ